MAAHPELLARDLDAVVVATPDFAHAEPAVGAAAAGCHLMVEKPLAMSTEDAQAIADAVAMRALAALRQQIGGHAEVRG